MVGPLDMAMLLNGGDPLSYPEACHRAALIWRARVQEASQNGSQLLDLRTGQEVTSGVALKLGSRLVRIVDASN